MRRRAARLTYWGTMNNADVALVRPHDYLMLNTVYEIKESKFTNTSSCSSSSFFPPSFSSVPTHHWGAGASRLISGKSAVPPCTRKAFSSLYIRKAFTSELRALLKALPCILLGERSLGAAANSPRQEVRPIKTRMFMVGTPWMP